MPYATGYDYKTGFKKFFHSREFKPIITDQLSIVNISSAIFECSVPNLNSCPGGVLPEFAFIGRANVGKTSLLNMLAGERDLTRVSTTTRHTRLINIFTINNTWRLVDLPGYGNAQAAMREMSRFNRAAADYLQHRTNLRCVFALVDSGPPPQEIDVEFVGWLARSAVPFVLVFTKTDRVNPAKVQINIAAFTERIAEWCETTPKIFTCSAFAKHGRRELLETIEAAMAPKPVVPEHRTIDVPVTIEAVPASAWNSGARVPNGKHPNRVPPG
jgi:GTP-binding protein